jgi:hypothetical protein
VLGPDGLSRFDALRRQAAARTAILYAFDLIEHDGEDLRDGAFLDRKATLARRYAIRRLASFSTNTSPKMARSFSLMLAGLAPNALSRSGWTEPIDPVLVRSGSRSGIPPAMRCSGSAARIGTSDYPVWPDNEPSSPVRNAPMWPALITRVRFRRAFTSLRPCRRIAS